jgi:hypothetical protein
MSPNDEQVKRKMSIWDASKEEGVGRLEEGTKEEGRVERSSLSTTTFYRVEQLTASLLPSTQTKSSMIVA